MTMTRGYADVLVGLQYGDEGKAKIIDHLAHAYDIIARFNGGANAGHTVRTPLGSAKLAQVPSGAFHPDKLLYIGSGCAVNLEKLAGEINALERAGLTLDGRLLISGRCIVVQPVHVRMDVLHGSHIGTTGNGIGPCYADLALRMRSECRTVVQLRDLHENLDLAFGQMATYDRLSAPCSKAHEAEIAATFHRLRAASTRILPFVTMDDLFLTRLVRAGKRVLFEGAQSLQLDVSLGDQPYVTSSHTSASFAYVGGDLSCHFHRKTIGVAKAIVSRVGAGPFPSEFGGMASASYCARAAKEGTGREAESARFDPRALLASGDPFELGIALRMLTDEYGTGSGRPRRIGALDVSQLADAVSRHAVDEIYLNKCDSLALFPNKASGAIPVFDEASLRWFPSFAGPLNASLPPSLRGLIAHIERRTGSRIAGIGTGPARDDIICFQ
ncbi:adenylosuccinate synthetase [Caballeronia sp. ATUFL_M1_KS5A]|uniref:adenylosuccinate synthetase n=1 Tax=Caballeronia sp. ATUFL_M1_KS5A TaxID=2921778 RepID=UPI0032EF5F41